MFTQKILVAGLIGAVCGALVMYVNVTAPEEGEQATEYDTTVSQRGPMGGPMMGHGGGAMAIQSERAFLEEMIPHHEEAIATAQEVLDRGATTPGMETLANNIIESQTAQVADMTAWYEAWFNQPYEPTGEYQPMMRELAPYSGEQLDKVFLHDMTMHHMGAIMMARSVQSSIEHEEMRELASDIIAEQSSEIQTMQRLFQEINSQ